MPYDIVTKSGIKLYNIPDEMAPDDPLLKTLAAREKTARDQDARAKYEAIANDPETKRKAAEMATEGMGTLEKLGVNLTSSVHSGLQGIAQIFGGGPSDQELKDKRIRDEALKESTNMHIMPEWMPRIGGMVQFVGENAPTSLIPAGKAVQVGSRLLPQAWRASKGIQAALTGGVAGGVGGFTQPVTSDESRTLNTGVGAGLGTVLPGAWYAAKGVVNRFRPGAAADRAAENLRRGLGGDAEAESVAQGIEARAQQRTQQHPAVQAVPETVAEATGSPAAARIEADLRRDTGVQDSWVEYLRNQNERRYGAVTEATRAAPFVERRTQLRDAAGDVNRNNALSSAGPVPQHMLVQPVVQQLQTTLASDAAVNPAVQTLVNLVVPRLQGATPGRLYELRKVLTDRLTAPIHGDELSAAVRGAERQTRQVVESIDEALDAASNGQWRHYLQRFSADSRQIDAAQAARDARNVFLRESVGNLGDSPEVTRQRVATATREAMSDFWGDRSDLSRPGQRVLRETIEQMRHAAEPQHARKLTGTSGGGSMTANETEAMLNRLIGGSKVPVLGKAITWATRGADTATKIELTRMMQDPQAAVAAIRSAIAARRPLTAAQQLLLQSQGFAAGDAAGAIMQQRELPPMQPLQ